MKAVRPALALSFLAVAGCAASTTTTGGDTIARRSAPDAAKAIIRDAQGRTVATGRIEEASGTVRVHVEAAGLAAGTYGTHVHSVGLCEAPAFTSAGPHWNPSAHQHGSENPQGPHAGDLPNLVVDASGHGSIDYAITGGWLTGGQNAMLDADKAAIVIHAQPDDYRTDPSGNSGTRIACGVLVPE